MTRLVAAVCIAVAFAIGLDDHHRWRSRRSVAALEVALPRELRLAPFRCRGFQDTVAPFPLSCSPGGLRLALLLAPLEAARTRSALAVDAIGVWRASQEALAGA